MYICISISDIRYDPYFCVENFFPLFLALLALPCLALLQLSDITTSSLSSESSYFIDKDQYQLGIYGKLSLYSTASKSSSSSKMAALLQSGVSLDASFVDSLSTSFKRSRMIVSNKATIQKATYTLQLKNEQLCSSSYMEEMNVLPREYSFEAYQPFISRFGTHVVVSCDIGGSLLISQETDKCTEKNVHKMQQTYSAVLGNLGSFMVEDSVSHKKIQGYTYSRSSIIVCGGDSSAYFSSTGNPWEDWTNSLFNQVNALCVLNYSLEPIWTTAAVPVIRANLEQAVMDYLQWKIDEANARDTAGSSACQS
jgi:hypothetical protein